MIEDPIFYNETKTSCNKKIEKVDNFESDTFSRYKMVIAVRDDLKMSTGKIAAQVGHGGISF